MNSNGLKLSNYVEYNGVTVQISELQHAQCTIYSSDFIVNMAVFYNKIKPIPITEKWLYNAGFSYCDGRMWFEKYGILSDYDKKYISMIDREGEHFSICNYVHELQNLYFALTGSELVFSTEP